MVLGFCAQLSEVVMRVGSGVCLVTFGVAASAMLLSAHHSTAAYDTAKAVSIKGIVTVVDWRNPHVRIHLDVTGSGGRAVNWDLETWGTGQLSLRGLTNGFLKA